MIHVCSHKIGFDEIDVSRRTHDKHLRIWLLCFDSQCVQHEFNKRGKSQPPINGYREIATKHKHQHHEK